MIFKYHYYAIHRIETTTGDPPCSDLAHTQKVKVCVKSSFQHFHLHESLFVEQSDQLVSVLFVSFVNFLTRSMSVLLNARRLQGWTRGEIVGEDRSLWKQ